MASENNVAYGVMLEGSCAEAPSRSAERWTDLLPGMRAASSTRGFFTTRFVWTTSSEAAMKLAVSLVKDELGELMPGTTWNIEVSEVWEATERRQEEGAGSGYTWFKT
jgi:hypothetical protein